MSGEVYTCASPLAGRCGVQHKSERTALLCSRKLERARFGANGLGSGRFYLPHLWECSSLIWGTSYPCDCGAHDRCRERKQRKQDA